MDDGGPTSREAIQHRTGIGGLRDVIIELRPLLRKTIADHSFFRSD
jgi:hypothetical protein